jgi:hypothetical protein
MSQTNTLLSYYAIFHEDEGGTFLWNISIATYHTAWCNLEVRSILVFFDIVHVNLKGAEMMKAWKQDTVSF